MFIRILIVMLLVVSNVLTDVKNYYPDLRCFPGFNQSVEGQSFLEQSQRHCGSEEAKSLESPFRCFKSCILMMLGVIVEGDKDQPLFATESVIASFFKETLFKGRNDDDAEIIAENIVSYCSMNMRLISEKNIPCEDWTHLYTCIEKSWECEVAQVEIA